MTSKFFRLYKKTLSSFPILTQGVQTGILMGSSDLVCQYYVEEKKQISWSRALQFTAVGLAYVVSIIQYNLFIYIY